MEQIHEQLQRLRRSGKDADAAAELLLSCEAGALIVPVRSILRGKDASWKAVLLERVIARLPKDVVLEWGAELFALAMNASEADMEAAVDELAESILVQWL